MAKQSKSQIVKEWKSSEIKIKKDSKGLLWVVLGKDKVKLPKETVYQTVKRQDAEDLLNKYKTEKLTIKLGRPTAYKIEYNEQARKLCLLGATDIEIADFFNVNQDTIYEWKKDFPIFSESIRQGKELADANVANKLYNRALGYEHEEEKIFNDQGTALRVSTTKRYPPDTTAAMFWLKNRQPGKWRDKQEVETTIKVEQPLFGDD